MDAIKPFFNLTYNSKDITTDVSLHLLEISYTDNVTGVSDELEIKLEDKELQWSNEWYPEKGALLALQIGYNNGQVLKPNPFQLDEVGYEFSKDAGDVVTIKGIGAGITKQVHTKRSHAHENKTLVQIVNTIAARNGLTVIGNIANITIGRVTQHREKDITFLNRLADEYGYAFTIKNNKLIFTPQKALEAIAKVATIDKTDIINGTITDKGTGIYEQASVKSHNPNANKVVQSTFTVNQVANKDGQEFTYLQPAANSLEVRTKTENNAQANLKSEAALHKANSLQQTGNITVEGNISLVAGSNIELTGIGKNSGVWHILKSTHRIDKGSGYQTEIEIKKVVPASISGSAKKPKTIATKNNGYTIVSNKNKDGVTFNTIKPK